MISTLRTSVALLASISAAILGGFLPAAAIGAPANDDFAGATSLATNPAGDSTVQYVALAGASAEISEPAHQGVAAAHSIWYLWTAPISHSYLLHGWARQIAAPDTASYVTIRVRRELTRCPHGAADYFHPRHR